MWKAEKWAQSAIGALIGTTIITVFTGSWSDFLFRWLTSIIPTRIIACFLFERENPSKGKKVEQTKSEPFIVSKYYDRMEKAALDILEDQKPVDRIIILWWGLDGLRMNEDGSLEWISRKKPEPVKQEASQNAMCQVTNPIRTEMVNIRTTFSADGMQQATAEQQAWNASMIASLQSFVIQAPAYPLYLNAGMGGSGGPAYYSQITDCCCNAKLR